MTVDSPPSGVAWGHPGWHMIEEIDVARLIAGHARLRLLCDRLEACADALPTLPQPPEIVQLCRKLAGLGSGLADDYRFLLGNPGPGPGPDGASALDKALLRQIAERYAAVGDRAGDIVAALDQRRDDLHPPSIEATGYILRSFFDTCRDALAFGELAVLELGRLRLTPAARRLLVAGLDRGRD